MSALNMGFAQLQVVPVMSGFNKELRKQLGNSFPSLGRASGADFGRGVASGFSDERASIESEVQALERNLAKAQDNLAKAKDKNTRASEAELTAIKQVEIAEAKLAEQRDSGRSSASKLLQAEENLRQKQIALQRVQDEAHRSTINLENATEDLTEAQTQLRTSTERANRELGDTSNSTDSAREGLSDVRDEAGRTRAGLGKLGDYMKGAFVGAIAAVSFGAVIGEMKEAIQLAGDFQQSTGAIDSIFKDQAGKMHAKAGSAAVDVGLDKNAYNELGSVLGAQMKNAGTPMDELADKTSNLITLGADLSSMFGGSTKEAVEAISSALKGEADPIERYGISMSQATLEAEALAKGLIKPVVDADLVADATTKMQVAQKKYNETVAKHGKDSMEAAKAQVTLNAAERAFDKATAGKIPKLEGEAKALAVQSALYSQSADAQGNFARESNTLQGQQERLNAEVANMKIAAGTAFLPAMTGIVTAIRTTVIPALQTMGQWIKDNQAWLKPLAVAIASAAGAFLVFKSVTSVIFGVTKAVDAFKGGFAALNIVMKANVFVLIATAIAGLVAGFIYLWNTNESFRGFFIAIWEGIKTAFNATVQWFSGILTSLGGFFSLCWQGIQSAVAAVVSFFQAVVAPMFVWFYQNVITPIFNAIKLVVTIVVTIIISIIKMWIWVWKNLLAPAITWVWENVLRPTFLAIGEFFKWVFNNLLKPAFNGLMTAFKAVGTALKWVWDFVLKPVFHALGTFFKWVWESILKPAFNAVKTGFQNIVNNIKYFWNTYLKPVFQAVGTFMRDTVAPIFKRAVDGIKDAWSGIKSAFKAVWDWVVENVFTPVTNLITKTIPDAFKKGVDFIKEAWNKVANIARKPINFVIETVYGGLRGTFNSVADSLGLPAEWRLPEVKPLAEFATGGYTGPGTKYQEAGVVHAGEFVLRKEATSRLRQTVGLDALEHMNQFGTMPGFAKGGYVRPVKGGSYTSRFGESRGAYPHAGLDIAVPIGTPVFSPLDGTVRIAKENAITGRSGLGMLIDHANGLSTYIGHLSRFIAQAGQQVKAGEQVALSGNTGRSTGPHLHAELHRDGTPIDPFEYINSGIIPTGGSGGGGGWNPLQALFDLKDKMVNGFKEQFGTDNMLGQIASSALGRIVNGPIDWIKEKAAAVGDFAKDTWSNAKDFFSGPDSPVQSVVREAAARYGWDSAQQWDSLSTLIGHESSWNPNAQNPNSTAYGLFQFLNSTWGTVGGSKTSDPGLQAEYGMRYIKQRYSDPMGAWSYWKQKGWYANGGLVKPTLYDNGGILAPGQHQMVSNLTRKPEAIYTNQQNRALQTLAGYAEKKLTSSNGDTYNISVPKPAASAEDIVGAVNHNIRANRFRGR